MGRSTHVETPGSLIRWRAVFGLAFLLATSILEQDAQAQLRPRWNRSVQGVTILPSPTSTPGTPRYDLHVSWGFEVEHLASPLDLSTNLRVLVDGEAVAGPVLHGIVVDPSLASCTAGPPCAGSCGRYTLDGVSGLDLVCSRDGPCSSEACDCDCGSWLTALVAGVALDPGDQIEILIEPAPSSASDDPSDNQRVFSFGGAWIGWNRGLSGVTARLSADGDSMYVRVSSYVEFDGPPGALPSELNLDAVVEFYQGPQLLGSQLLVIPASHYGDECSEIQCQMPCAIVNGVEQICSHGGPGHEECVCGDAAGGLIPEVPASSPTYLDQPIEARLKAAPGALAEVLHPDDSAMTRVVSAGGVAPAAAEGLRPNVPNPFSPRTTIAFRVETPSALVLEIFDLAGRRVRTLASGRYPVGEWRLEWDGRSDRGDRLSPGPYLCRLRLDGRVQTRKLTLLGR